MSFTIFQNEKTPFQSIKSRSSKSLKIDIFPKGLSHGFGPNMAIFPTFLFKGNIGQENVFYDILEPKKHKVQKVKKLTFFQRVNPCFSRVQKWRFFQLFFFRHYRPGKCLLRYSRTKYAFLVQIYKIKKLKKSKN